MGHDGLGQRCFPRPECPAVPPEWNLGGEDVTKKKILEPITVPTGGLGRDVAPRPQLDGWGEWRRALPAAVE